MEDTSITERAYTVLRAELISCRLVPGSRLNISLLHNKLSLSQAAVREALSRLAAEGLVEIERNRGFRVAPISASGFRDLTQALWTIEEPCLRTSILQGDTAWELNLISAYHRSSRTLQLVVAEKEGLDSYANERLNFYEALLAACDNRWLLWSWRLLYSQNARYRHIYMPLAKFELELNPHHQSIMDAVLARDVEQVVKLSIQNYDQVTKFIEQQMSETDGSKGKPVRSRAAAPIEKDAGSKKMRVSGPRAKAVKT